MRYYADHKDMGGSVTSTKKCHLKDVTLPFQARGRDRQNIYASDYVNEAGDYRQVDVQVHYVVKTEERKMTLLSGVKVKQIRAKTADGDWFEVNFYAYPKAKK
jgi:hypothetical protein